MRNNSHPQWSQVSEDLKKDLELLQWARFAQSKLVDLPSGKLKESLEERINNLLDVSEFCNLKQTLLESKSLITSLGAEKSALEKRCIRLEDELSSMESSFPERSSQIPWIYIVMILVITLSLLYQVFVNS
jgi:predicted nuclease with TOPRIM domain